MTQFGFFKIADDIKRMAIDQRKYRVADGGVIAGARRQVSDPAINWRFDVGLRQLPVGVFQSRVSRIGTGFGGGDAGFRGFGVSGRRFQGVIDGVEILGRNKVFR